MDDPLEWLLAQIAEDRRRVEVARAGSTGWDPELALAECEARQRLVELHHTGRPGYREEWRP